MSEKGATVLRTMNAGSIPTEDVTDTDIMFKIPEIHRTETDAIHSRFMPKEKYLYKCNSCQFSSPDWKKVKKHFFEHCPALTADYSEKTCQCGGPSFKYLHQNETHLYHSCKKWAEYEKKKKKSPSWESFFSFKNSRATSITSVSETSIDRHTDSPVSDDRQIESPSISMHTKLPNQSVSVNSIAEINGAVSSNEVIGEDIH